MLFQNHSQLQRQWGLLIYVQPVEPPVWSQDLGSSADRKREQREFSQGESHGSYMRSQQKQASLKVYTS